MKATAKFITDSILHSYAILFFSQNRVFGALLLLVSFLNPLGGLAGLTAVVVSLIISKLLDYHHETTRMGIYSFNPLLFGLGLGAFYQFNAAFVIWLLVGGLLVAVLSVTLASMLARFNFPLLSFPFVIGFWLLLLSANGIYHMGLKQVNSAVLNEFFAPGKETSYSFPLICCRFIIPHYPGLFFRALSAVIFQNSVLAGLVIATGIFFHSRIHFSLMVLSFVAACLVNRLTGIYPEGISYYHLGANVMMVSGAVGCFFFIPSARSYLWAIISIPVTFLLINGLTKLFGFVDLPLLSFPFCLLTILFISFFRQRQSTGKLQLTLLQHYSPERNLYQQLNGAERLHELNYLKLGLPFMGAWTVSQGYDGDITHKLAWGKALDFVVSDDEGKTYQLPGTEPQHFYCYNKPVLACADGTVESVADHIDDNPIGIINIAENWGNSIVIKHTEGLYSQVSHLKKNSGKVKPGDFVREGDVIGLCGNSGRSPEPHLHFQVQVSPNIGSKTISYPFACYFNQSSGKNQLRSFETPQQGDIVSRIPINRAIKQAFDLQPGYTAVLLAPGHQTEQLEVFTDAWNQSYILSKTTGAVAYFINNGTAFYFTSFYGSEKSLLFYFYLTAYKIVFATDPDLRVTDTYPLQVSFNKPVLWLHDLVAPFRQFMRLSYENKSEGNGQDIVFHIAQIKTVAGSRKETMSASLHVSNNTIKNFGITLNGTQIDIQWIAESAY
ncbi:urea transporter [Mucilaginibacter sp. X4EP1]|uniref:urea transporter n=1 Tax=Mucilaginibacter sp. X4EP1 TaxID=2723092 RepID=UPI00216A4C12|nr:urea transporter [Mucilaginibacter sp. X4EP1]MCS3812822.1 murein DD-endopeptidase MepM/ murein hydrolase activator NlpD [Mucilaginibacter sp. X4EP1]